MSLSHYSRLQFHKISKFRLQVINRTISNEVKKDDEFRVLELFPMRKETRRKQIDRFQDAHVLPPREKRMPIDQDWPSVWPTAKCFRPSVVPLPLYQGYDQKRAPPGKYANAELMKIPNFLHLTPPAVKRQCAAIKKFCNSFPENLKSDKDCDHHFPVEIITNDFSHSSPTIRDERSRIVTLKIKLSALKLDYHGRDKLLRLVGPDRYNCSSDMLSIVADRCPLRKQNYDYLIYLLTAVHHESWVTEPWEHEKTEADMEKFFFEGSRIQKNIIQTVSKVKSSSVSKEETLDKDLKESEEVGYFAKTVTALLNEGENNENILNYKESVLKALNLVGSKTVV